MDRRRMNFRPPLQYSFFYLPSLPHFRVSISSPLSPGHKDVKIPSFLIGNPSNLTKNFIQANGSSSDEFPATAARFGALPLNFGFLSSVPA
jgi:hypothetical protein